MREDCSSVNLQSLCYLKSCCLDNNWLDQWLGVLGCWLVITLVVTSLVWLSDSLQTEKLLLEALKLATDSNHIFAAAALERLADHALLLSVFALVDQFVLSTGKAMNGWVEKGLNISRVEVWPPYRDLLVMYGAHGLGHGEGDHHKGEDDFSVHCYVWLDRPRIQMSKASV